MARRPAPRVVAAPATAEPAPIDLLDLAGGTALKKYAPMVFAAFAAAAALFTLGRLQGGQASAPQSQMSSS